MNLKRILAVALTAAIAVSAFTACSGAQGGDDGVKVISSESSAQGTAQAHIANIDDEGYVLEVNGTKIRVNTDAKDVIAALGDDYIYFEAPSCAGIGMSKTYTYNNAAFVINTVPVGNIDLISNVGIFLDTVTTPEGIFIGSSKDDVIAAYGQPTSDVGDTLVYEKNDTMLVISMNEGVVAGIAYNQIV
ncbi:hypothetical protein SAMN02910456_02571 [Ruminococcaceae bacterium YRB3002]|nr:hypothetical protein SAMN02910456_02571 [Ruminococcaceae bacterium YRB3002]